MSELLGLPLQASAHAGRVDAINLAVHGLMAAVFVGWGAFFIYTLFKFRRSKNPRADYTGVKSHVSKYVEIAVVVGEAILLVGFSIPFWASDVVVQAQALDDAANVRVVAQQFVWNVHYPGPDGVFGRTDVALVNEQTNPIGLDAQDGAAKDDVVTVGDLRLVVDRPVIVHLSSKDVIHSFSLPELRVKRDAIPGMTIAVPFTPTMTTESFREATGDESRNFEIACAQLCGATHYRMLGVMTVLPEEDFEAWYAKKLEEKTQAGEEDDFWN